MREIYLARSIVLLTRIRQRGKQQGWFMDEDDTYGVHLSPEIDEDMGRPDEITVTIKPGDWLNTEENGHAHS
jgi:hypothetical protein